MKAKPSKFMQKHSRGKILTNPPRRRRTSRVVSSKAVAARTSVIHAKGIGHAIEIRYARDGKTFKHKFGPGVVLAATDDNKLIIAGKSLRVRSYIED